MDIKEIALKHAREYLTFKLGGRKGLDVEEIVCDDEIYKEIVNELAQQFEALVAELAKQNEPVGWFKYDKVSRCWHPQYDEYAERYAKEQGWQQLYTYPPTAEQIANETADACARYVNRFINGDGILNEVWISEIEEALRCGAWKEFK